MLDQQICQIIFGTNMYFYTLRHNIVLQIKSKSFLRHKIAFTYNSASIWHDICHIKWFCSNVDSAVRIMYEKRINDSERLEKLWLKQK